MDTPFELDRFRGPWSAERIQRHLDASTIPLRLACTAPSGWPVVLSLWFVHEEGALWCATIDSASVLRALTAEPRCAFEIAPDEPPYHGIRGRARASLHPERGGEILERLIERYLPAPDTPLARWLRSRVEREVAIRLVPTQLRSWDFTERMSAGRPTERERR